MFSRTEPRIQRQHCDSMELFFRLKQALLECDDDDDDDDSGGDDDAEADPRKKGFSCLYVNTNHLLFCIQPAWALNRLFKARQKKKKSC